MDKSVAVPLPLLDEIFRLLEYLDFVSRRDDLNFHKTGCSTRFEQDTAIWGLKMKIRQLQPHIVDAYLLTVDEISEDEIHGLKKWVASGNSIFENPYMIFDESGSQMDFINGCRVGLDMPRSPLGYFGSGNWDDEDLPF